MVERTWAGESRKNLICVDSYHKGVPVGRFYNPYMEAENFESLSQLLVKMDALLDELQMPQSYTAPRTFSSMVEQIEARTLPIDIRKGAKATFELQVIFRQHTSWQGVVVWREQNLEQSFRSVLELVLLMDSVLRSAEGSECLS